MEFHSETSSCPAAQADKGARAPPGARAAHASIQFASEPRSAAAAAVISTAAAVPAATGIPTAPAVPTAAAEDDDQHDDPQAASAAPAVIAAPHIEVPPEDEDLRRRCAALKLSYVRGGKGLQIEAAEFHQNGCHLGPAGWIRRPESPLTRRNDQPRRHCPGDCVPGPAGHLSSVPIDGQVRRAGGGQLQILPGKAVEHHQDLLPGDALLRGETPIPMPAVTPWT